MIDIRKLIVHGTVEQSEDDYNNKIYLLNNDELNMMCALTSEKGALNQFNKKKVKITIELVE